MKSKIYGILVFAGIMLLSGCADQSKVNYGGYSSVASVDNAGKYPNSGFTTAAYNDYSILYSNKKKELVNKMAGEKEMQEELRAIPKGGMATVTLYRSTIDSANTENFEYVLYENGKQIYRKKGRNQIANTPSSGGGKYWWNIDVVVFPKPITSQMTLYVIDNLSQSRDKYIITKQSSVSSKK